MSNTSTKQLTGNAGTSTATQAWTVSWAFRPVENIDIPAVSIENNVATVTCGGDMKSLNYALAKSVIMNTGVTTVDLQSTNISSLTPDEIKISEISSNTIYMMPESYATDAPNFIINGTCSDLVLTDKANFAPAKAFTARQASYQKSGLDAGGWYSAVLPYDFNVPAGVTVLTNATVGAATINFAEATEGTVISANTPFLYKTTAGTVDFCATNTTISTDTPSSRALLGTYTLIPAGEATGKLILNADGSAFATASQKASIPAFRAYLNAQAGSKTFTISIDGELTGIADSDTLNAQSSPIDVHSIDGKLLRSQVDPLTALRGLPKGTYIVGGKKIHK